MISSVQVCNYKIQYETQCDILCLRDNDNCVWELQNI